MAKYAKTKSISIDISGITIEAKERNNQHVGISKVKKPSST